MSRSFVRPLGKRENTRRAMGLRPRLEGLEDRLAPATFRVSTVLDTVAVNLRTGKDASGHISLRSAIMAANARPNGDTIILPKGTYTLTIPGANEDQDATGDLDIINKLTIKGAGAASTIIDGNNLDRVFEILSTSATIAKVTIQHGRASHGAGVLNSGGNVTLSSVLIQDNLAIGSSGSAGGGVGGESMGGGVEDESGTLKITNSVITANHATGGAGGAGTLGTEGVGADGAPGANGAAGTGAAGTSAGNGGTAFGGGISVDTGAKLFLSGVKFSGNTVTGGAGGTGGPGGYGFGGSGGDNAGAGPGNGGGADGGAGGLGGLGGTAFGGGVYSLGIVTVSGPTTFLTNLAAGGSGGAGGVGGLGQGGNGGNSSSGGFGGSGSAAGGGRGGSGNEGGGAFGGGVASGPSGAFTSTSPLDFVGNTASGGTGGTGGAGGSGFGGAGGAGGGTGNGGTGGSGIGSVGGAGSFGGIAAGGAFDNAGGILSIAAPRRGAKGSHSPPVISFTGNQADAGTGGAGGVGGGGYGGQAGRGGTSGTGGTGGFGEGSTGGPAGAGGMAFGGALANFGMSSFLGITVNLVANQASGGTGGAGGQGGLGAGGDGGDGFSGGNGGSALGGDGGNGNNGGNGEGGAVFNDPSSTLTINPTKGAKKGSKQSKATDLVTANHALGGFAGAAGPAGQPHVGIGRAPGGADGTEFLGKAGSPGSGGTGAGGGLYLSSGGTATIDNANITGNQASTSDNDVFGTFMP